VFYDDTTLALLATQYRSTACFDTSDPGQIGTETLQHCSGGSKASGLFVTSTLWTKLSNCTAIKYEVWSTLWSKVSHPNFLVYVACRPTSLSQWRMQSAIVYKTETSSCPAVYRRIRLLQRGQLRQVSTRMK